MLIRSQNKRKLIVIGELVIETVKKNRWSKEEMFEIVDGPHVLGTYSTEKKALKVLDQIQKKHDEYMYQPESPILFGNGYKQTFAYCPPKTFQMPADEDV